MNPPIGVVLDSLATEASGSEHEEAQTLILEGKVGTEGEW